MHAEKTDKQFFIYADSGPRHLSHKQFSFSIRSLAHEKGHIKKTREQGMMVPVNKNTLFCQEKYVCWFNDQAGFHWFA